MWNEEISEARFMTSFDTTIEDIKNLAAVLRNIV